MSRTGRTNGEEVRLTDLIRRQIGSEINRRHLTRLPAFALPRDTPEGFGRLLAELDRAERGSGAPPGKA